VNLLELAKSLPGGEVLDIRLFDTGYDRQLQSNGQVAGTTSWKLARAAGRAAYGVLRLLGLGKEALKRRYIRPIDQTSFPEVLAQIQCIVRKG
jgi:hypothetical protein